MTTTNTTELTVQTTWGDIAIRRFDAAHDATMVQSWVTAPHARYWGMMQASVTDVAQMYQRHPELTGWIGVRDGIGIFLGETYNPADTELADHYAVTDSDVGMHLLVAPADTPRSGTTRAAMLAVMQVCFSRCGAKRVVVEPDIHNSKIRRLNTWVGFTEHWAVPLLGKTGMFSTCSAAQFMASGGHAHLVPGSGKDNHGDTP